MMYDKEDLEVLGSAQDREARLCEMGASLVALAVELGIGSQAVSFIRELVRGRLAGNLPAELEDLERARIERFHTEDR